MIIKLSTFIWATVAALLIVIANAIAITVLDLSLIPKIAAMQLESSDAGRLGYQTLLFLCNKLPIVSALVIILWGLLFIKYQTDKRQNGTK